MSRRILMTTSWDDGHRLDIRLANLLTKYHCKGTFYLAKSYVDEPLLEDEIFSLSQLHEIGAHTIHHPDLTQLSESSVREELIQSRMWLQNIIKKDVPLFCFPRGRYNQRVAEIAKECFRGVRTVTRFCTTGIEDNFFLPTTLNVYPYPLRSDLFPSRRLFMPFLEQRLLLRELGVHPWRLSWLSLAKAVFDHAFQHGRAFHLWGHSWEIERYGLWDQLECFLKYCSHRPDCDYVTNGELLERLAKKS